MGRRRMLKWSRIVMDGHVLLFLFLIRFSFFRPTLLVLVPTLLRGNAFFDALRRVLRDDSI